VLHDDVDEESAAGEPQLAPLPVQVGDGLSHVAHGAGSHTRTVVEHPVDGGLAQACLPSDLPDRIRMPHGDQPDGLRMSRSRSGRTPVHARAGNPIDLSVEGFLMASSPLTVVTRRSTLVKIGRPLRAVLIESVQPALKRRRSG
jgi:hypothetical protein